MPNFLKDKRGSAIMTTMFLLTAMVVISIIAIEMISSGIARRRTEGSSAKAFYAAESGVEQAMLLFKQEIFSSTRPVFTSCAKFATGAYLDFNTKKCIGATAEDAAAAKKNLEGNTGLPTYVVHIKIDGQDVAMDSRGSSGGTNRQLSVKFCMPTCVGVPTGGADGCGGLCN